MQTHRTGAVRGSRHATRLPHRASRSALRVSARQGMGMPGAGGQPNPEWDPENIYKGVAPKEGIIARRLMQKRIEQDKEFAAQVKFAIDEDKQKVWERRALRDIPKNVKEHPYELAEYFLNTDAEDMEYEVSRCRPLLDASFFKFLDESIGAERFRSDGEEPDQERLAEMEMLRQYLEEMCEAIDKKVKSTSTAADRLRALLASKEKKELILKMAGDNEIDQAFMDLLQENITRAKAAEQEDAAKFMEKVKQACEKYAIISPAVEVLPPTAPMPGKAGKAAPVVTSPGGIILPGSVSTPPPAAAAPAAKVPAGAKPAGPSGLIL